MIFKGISLSVFSILDLPHLTTIHFHQRSFYKTSSLVLDHLPIFNHVVFEECSFHNIQQMIQVLIKYIYKIECPFHDGSCIIQNALRKIESFQIICDQCKYRCDFIISFNEVKRNS